jgi:tRNA-specific 2-thiouridylase
MIVSGASWTTSPGPSLPRGAQVRLRHRHPPAPGVLRARGAGVEVEFDEPQRAPAPGQAAVFYDADDVLGGGTISGLVEEAA